MIVSANLAKGAIAMSRRKVIVKRLNAIQNLGAMDVLCTDKTGTLTQDNIFVGASERGRRRGCARIAAGLAQQQQPERGKNLMDRAVLKFGEQTLSAAQCSQFQKVDELPFDFVRRRVSVVVEDLQTHRPLLICKGAVEEMLAAATTLRQGESVIPLCEQKRVELLNLTQHYNQQGFRVLLVATREHGIALPLSSNDECELTIEGC